MKKKIATALCLTLSMFLISCSEQQTSETNTQEQSPAQENVGLANPLVDCDTLDQAEKIVGFEAEIPHSLPLGYAQTQIQTISDTTIQIFYKNGENEILYRQGKGAGNISGDYNKYEQEKTLKLNDLEILIKGNNDKASVATWQEGNFSYSIATYSAENGLDLDILQNMILSIKK